MCVGAFYLSKVLLALFLVSSMWIDIVFYWCVSPDHVFGRGSLTFVPVPVCSVWTCVPVPVCWFGLCSGRYVLGATQLFPNVFVSLSCGQAYTKLCH